MSIQPKYGKLSPEQQVIADELFGGMPIYKPERPAMNIPQITKNGRPMSNIDKQALREAAQKALPAMKRLLMMPNDELFDEALLNVDGDVDAANAFNLLTGPETVLALLDELETKEEQRANWFQMAQKLGEDLDAAEKRIAELEASNISPAAADVLSERRRHITAEGWTPEHDDQHVNFEMAIAGGLYAISAIDSHPQLHNTAPSMWPWDKKWWRPSGPRRDLVKAAALLLAEIERIDRAVDAGKGE